MIAQYGGNQESQSTLFCKCICKVLSIPVPCVGSGDPVRVLRLYTTNTLDIFEAFIAEAYVQLAATDSNVSCSSPTL